MPHPYLQQVGWLMCEPLFGFGLQGQQWTLGMSCRFGRPGLDNIGNSRCGLNNLSGRVWGTRRHQRYTCLRRRCRRFFMVESARAAVHSRHVGKEIYLVSRSRNVDSCACLLLSLSDRKLSSPRNSVVLPEIQINHYRIVELGLQNLNFRHKYFVD